MRKSVTGSGFAAPRVAPEEFTKSFVAARALSLEKSRSTPIMPLRGVSCGVSTCCLMRVFDCEQVVRF